MTLDCVRLSGRLGAEVRGIDLAARDLLQQQRPLHPPCRRGAPQVVDPHAPACRERVEKPLRRMVAIRLDD